ncbi:MAG TPA: hypothetical protein VG944_09475, partial [Fimbriimonas sp.]|nr:hypothetical protein [Fimbriimonas sp.]
MGIATYHKLQRRINPRSPDDFLTLAEAANRFGRSDLLMGIALRIFFTEPWMMLLPWVKGFDRSKGLDEAISVAIEKACRHSKGRSGEGQKEEKTRAHTANEPMPARFYGTTSVHRGDRFVVGSHRIELLRGNLH